MNVLVNIMWKFITPPLYVQDKSLYKIHSIKTRGFGQKHEVGGFQIVFCEGGLVVGGKV